MLITRLIKRSADWNREICDGLCRKFPRSFGSESYVDELMKRINETLVSEKPSTVLEVGGIDRPLLRKGHGYRYDGLDIEERESCYAIYDEFLVQSIEAPVGGGYDMIVSITLLEHVPENSAAIKNIYDALKPGGITHHYIPAKGHPYALALRLVGPVWQKRLIRLLRSQTVNVTGYPTYFDHCSVREMKTLFEENGFADIEIRAFYRANDYFAFFIPFYIFVSFFENLCALMQWTGFASGFVITAKRPTSRQD